MNNDNGIELIIDVVFAIIPKLVVFGPKAQDLVISFILGEAETLPQLHFRALQIRSEIFFFCDETGQINNLTGKYIVEMSKLKHKQQYINIFEKHYRNF